LFMKQFDSHPELVAQLHHPVICDSLARDPMYNHSGVV